MKLLLVTSYLDDGGAEKWMLDTLKNMDRTNVEIDYYFWCDIKVDTFVQQYKDLGVNLYFRKLNEKNKTFMYTLKNDFKKFCKLKGPYDAVHLNGTKITYQMIIMNVSKTLNIPTRIVHGHNPFVNKFTGIKNYLRELVKKQILNDATIISGCSKLVVKNLYGFYALESDKFHIFQNGIDLEKYSDGYRHRNEYRKELGLKYNDKVFLHIGRFSKEKNHYFLLDVFNEIVKKEARSKLILIGKGVEEENIYNKIRKLGIEESIIHVPYTNETEKYYSAADVFLFPSLYEGLGLVLLEAQASGLPCLISDVIPNEVLVNDNIKKLPLKEYSIWSDAALSLIGKRCDKAQENIYNYGYDIKLTAEDFLRCCKGEK